MINDKSKKKCKCHKCGKQVLRIEPKKNTTCKECQRKRENYVRRKNRRRGKDTYTEKYEKTKKGFLVRKYRNMKSRVLGIQKLKAHLYKGKELLPKQEFYDWAFDSPEFHKLFKEWEISNYDRKLCPTVNRINPAEGYYLENMEWLTHSENSALANR